MLTLLTCLLAACGGGTPDVVDAADPAAPMAVGQGEGGTAAATVAPLALPLGESGRVVVHGLPQQPPLAAAWPDDAPAGRRFHVDSVRGNDSRDGLSGGRAWRSLARLAAADLQPGDRVQLACGSVWKETLRLPASGTAARPIVVAAAPGCTQPPTIDGSADLPAGNWRRVAGDIYQAALADSPLQLFGTDGPWVEAHHPNRSSAGTTWLSLAADGNTSSADGRPVSTQLVTGSDLQLPAGARLGPGTRVRVRTAAYVVDDLPLAGASGAQLNLAAPTTYAVKAGWGYLLTGQAWMVDSAGEWHHDGGSRQLRVQALRAGSARRLPTQATVLASGLDLDGRAHVVVEGLLVRKTGTGALLRRSQGVQLRNSRFEDLADRGIDAADSRDTVIESNLVQRTGTDAVFAGGMAAVAASGLVVRNNLVRDSGVRLLAGVPQTLPRRSYAAILAGRQATVSGNVIVDAGYIGIRVFEGSTVSGNVVTGACSVLDDCGAIYTLGAGNGSRISGNLVWQVRGNAAGKPPAARAPQAQGIYLDDDASGVLVDGNTVIDADHGVLLHDAAANTVRGNRLYGHRVAALWLQETRSAADGSGLLRDNSIEANLFAPVHTLSRSLLIESSRGSTVDFGRFDFNRYFDATPGRIGTVAGTGGWRDVDASDWLGSSGLVGRSGADTHGSGSSTDGHAGLAVAGASVVPNGDLASGAAGWSHWNASNPAGQLQLQACGTGTCLRYTGGAPTGLVSSPTFALQADRWYRLSVDLATDSADPRLQLVVRRAGGDYASLADRDLAVRAAPQLQRHTLVFRSRAADAGVRFDIEGLAAGRSVTLANLQIVPIAPSAAARVSVALANAGSTPIDAPCPLPAAQAALCASLADLADTGGRRVSWPLRLPARSAVLLRGVDSTLPDADRDGIPDQQDRCAATPARQPVDAAGCAQGQR
jgi:parallel beta-helix repeat protein